jgi:hypothetical protein
MVRQLEFAALGTGRSLNGAQKIMRPSHISSCSGMSLYRICHGNPSFLLYVMKIDSV